MAKFYINLIYLIAFLDLFAVGLLIPLLPGHVRKLGGSNLFVGLLGSFYSGCQLTSGPLFGSLSDLNGRRSVLWYTLVLCSACYFYVGLTDSILFILMTRIILGVCKHTQMLTKALVPDYINDASVQASVYGKMAAISGCGFTLSPIVGGHIAEDYEDNGIFICSSLVAIIFLINAALTKLLKDDSHIYIKRDNNNETRAKPLEIVFTSIKQSAVNLYNIDWKLYWDVFLFKSLASLCMGIYFSNYALYLKTEFQLTPKQIGYTMAFQSVICSACSFLINFINDFYKSDVDYTLRNMHVFLALTVSLLGLRLSWSMIGFLLFLIPLSISNAIARLITLEMVLKRSENHHRGKLIGASNSVRSISGVLAPMLAGSMAHYLGVTTVLFAASLSAFVGFLLSVNARWRSISSVREKAD